MRKCFKIFVGTAFMLFSLHLAAVSVLQFVQGSDGGSLIINLLGALIFFLVGAWASGLLPYVLKKCGMNMRALGAKWKLFVAILLVAVVLLSGVAMVVFGVREAVSFVAKTRDYVTTTGYYSGNEIFSSDEDGITYRLAYTYTVEGETYQVLTTSGTQVIPKLGTQKQIRYNPQEPNQAVVAGDGLHVGLLLIGSLFTGGALTMVLAALHIKGKRKIGIVEIVMGMVFCGFGVGTIYVTAGSFSLTGAFSYMGILTVIPMLLLAAGVILLIRGLFFKK